MESQEPNDERSRDDTQSLLGNKEFVIVRFGPAGKELSIEKKPEKGFAQNENDENGSETTATRLWGQQLIHCSSESQRRRKERRESPQ
jgi:hypothetical protein